MKIVKNNKLLIILIALYSLAIFSVIAWGIPSQARPFTYNMDEWHQMSAVRALFSHGTPNVPGAAHGSIFQFFLSGVYLIPFVVFGLVNPFAIHSSISNLAMQEKLFIVLRSNTLLFGVLSIIVLAIIAKKHLNSNSVLTALLFVCTPIWLTLSSNFKYDIALIFWILLSTLAILNYIKSPTLKNYIISAIPCALAFATKVSAVPMLAIYIASFFIFTPHWQKKYKHLVWGVAVFLAIFVVFGIPDLFFRWSDYMEYLSSNLVSSVKADSNYILGVPNKWIYIFFIGFPMIFGHIFYFLFFIAFVYWLIKIIRWLYFKKYADHKGEIFIFFSLIIFILSLTSLGLGATGNRVLVILPFLGLLSAKFIINVLKTNRYKTYLSIFIGILIFLQFCESSVVIYAKYGKSVLQQSSSWIVGNISKGTTIGIENIPIYQSLPDIVLREYYLKATDKLAKISYEYEIVSATSKKLPKVVIISDRYLDEKFEKKSPKKDLLDRLKKENYKVTEEFRPNLQLYKLFHNDLDYYLSGLNFVFPVTIYERS
jgi:hypothetical protein